MQRIRVFGAGIRAQIAADLIDWHFADRLVIEGYYDDRVPTGHGGPGGRPVLGTVSDGLAALAEKPGGAFIAFGTRHTAHACRLFLELEACGVTLVSLIAPTAHVSPSARIGRNALVMPGVFLGHGVQIGHLFCAHGGSAVEHHGRLGHSVLLGPGVAAASKVAVGSYCFLGAGTSIIPERSVGEGTLVGAGAVVIHDLPAHVVAAGSPARPLRAVQGNDEVPHREAAQQLAAQGFPPDVVAE